MKKRRRIRKKRLTIKEREKKMLRGSEWILLGILFAGIAEAVVKHYGLTWRYLPYTFAIFGVVASRFFLRIMRVFSNGITYFLDSLSDR